MTAADARLRDLLTNPVTRALILNGVGARVFVSAAASAWPLYAAISGPQHLLGGIGPLIPAVAATGLITAAAGAGSLLANSLGQRAAERRGSRRVLRSGALGYTLIGVLTGALLLLGFLPGGILLVGLLAFLTGLASPGLSGLTRAWWPALALDERGPRKISALLAHRGLLVEPVLAAAAYSVGAALAGLMVVAPWTVIVFLGLAAAGLLGLTGLPDPYARPVGTLAAAEGVAGSHRWFLAVSYAFYHAARALLTLASVAILLAAGAPAFIGLALAAPSIGNAAAGLLFAARSRPDANLERAVLRGLLGQALPTLALLAWVLLTPRMPAVTVIVVLALTLVAGILKAPVPAAIYVLSAARRPEESLGASSARIAQGMTAGGMVGPVLGAAIAVAGSPALLLGSAVLLGVCAAGVRLDPRRLRA